MLLCVTVGLGRYSCRFTLNMLYLKLYPKISYTKRNLGRDVQPSIYVKCLKYHFSVKVTVYLNKFHQSHPKIQINHTLFCP